MAVQSGTINAIIAGMSATDERKQSVDFSDPYYKATHVLIVKKDSKYASAKTLDDLKGCSVTSQQGTTMYDSSAKQIKGATIQEALPDIPSLIVAVSSGRTDVAIVEKPMALAAIATNKDLAMVEFPEGSGFDVDSGITNIAVAAKKGDSAVIDACNKTLKGISDEEKDKMICIGNPNVPTPECVKEKLMHLLETENPFHLHGYTTSAGDEEARDAIAEGLNDRYGTHFTRENLYFTVGAACALNICFRALCNPGDEFILFAILTANAFPSPASVWAILLCRRRLMSLIRSKRQFPEHVRISYCVSTEQIERALPAFKTLAEEYKN